MWTSYHRYFHWKLCSEQRRYNIFTAFKSCELAWNLSEETDIPFFEACAHIGIEQYHRINFDGTTLPPGS